MHKSKVKSLNLDHFTREQIDILLGLGNSKVNSILPNGREKYDQQLEATVDFEEALEENSLIGLLQWVLADRRKSEDSRDWIMECLKRGKYLQVAFLLLWGWRVSLEHLEAAIACQDISISLIFSLLKRKEVLKSNERMRLLQLTDGKDILMNAVSCIESESEPPPRTEHVEDTAEAGVEKKKKEKREIIKDIRNQISSHFK